MRNSFICALFFLVLSAGIVLAGSTTLTTYYPAPTGNYNQVIANNIGIGTSSPGYKLDVYSGGAYVGDVNPKCGSGLPEETTNLIRKCRMELERKSLHVRL